MKKLFYLSTLFILSACAEEGLEDLSNESQTLSGVVMNVPDYIDQSLTRTTLTPTSTGVNFAWKAGDKVAVYTESTAMSNFDINQIGSDAKSATFDGGGFNLSSGAKYYAFYPYNASCTSKTSITVNYEGQLQTANNDATHLADCDYMTASAIAAGTNDATFNFKHLGAIVKVNASGLPDKPFKSLEILNNVPANGTIDLTKNSPAINVLSNSHALRLNLNNISPESGKLTAYIMVAPSDLSSDQVIFILTDTDGKFYIAKCGGKNLVAGNAYGFNASFTECKSLINLFSTTKAGEYIASQSSMNELYYEIMISKKEFNAIFNVRSKYPSDLPLVIDKYEDNTGMSTDTGFRATLISGGVLPSGIFYIELGGGPQPIYVPLKIVG